MGAYPGQLGPFGEFTAEILRLADADVEFTRYDGDRDGHPDAIFIVLQSIPDNFLLGPATGISWLGFDGAMVADDGARIDAQDGTVQRGRSFAELAGTVGHEYGHMLGLPDLWDYAFVRANRGRPPAEDSAEIGAWGLMGWGARRPARVPDPPRTPASRLALDGRPRTEAGQSIRLSDSPTRWARPAAGPRRAAA
ncbi:MAG: hypothetical protein ABIL09_20395 [Gemmatimonadota bacterium]